MAAINIIEIESDDDLDILDEIKDIAPNFSFKIWIDWDKSFQDRISRVLQPPKGSSTDLSSTRI